MLHEDVKELVVLDCDHFPEKMKQAMILLFLVGSAD